MPLSPVFRDQVEGGGQDQRLDLLLQIVFAPALQRGAFMLAERLELEGQKGVNIQPPGQIILGPVYTICATPVVSRTVPIKARGRLHGCRR